MKKQPELTIYEIPTVDLVPYANNAKEHTRGQVETIVNSFALVCRDVVPVGSSLGISFDRLTVESLRVSSRRCLGQILRQIRKLFRNSKPAVSFLSRGQKRVGFEARHSPKWMPKRVVFLSSTCLADSNLSIVDTSLCRKGLNELIIG